MRPGTPLLRSQATGKAAQPPKAKAQALTRSSSSSASHAGKASSSMNAATGRAAVVMAPAGMPGHGTEAKSRPATNASLAQSGVMPQGAKASAPGAEPNPWMDMLPPDNTRNNQDAWADWRRTTNPKN